MGVLSSACTLAGFAAIAAVAACSPRQPSNELRTAATPAPPPLWPLPPSGPDEAQAKAALEKHGYHDITGLERVGNYWQGQAARSSGRVTVYLLDNGGILESPPLIGAP